MKSRIEIIVFLTSIILISSCSARKTSEEKMKIKMKFESPEVLVECFYDALSKGDNRQISYCFGEPNSTRRTFNEMKGIKYRILKQEIIADSLKFSRIGDLTMTTVEYYKRDTMERYFTLSKLDTTWIISEFSTQVESKMQETENNAFEKLDSIDKN